MIAAEIMRAIYHRLLRKIRRSDFDVFHFRHRLGRWTKLAVMADVALRARRPRRRMNKVDNAPV